ncbi:MAG: patatin-like phospholipase family protein [Candidatus Obscuribacterales bacterium]|nr:patatin-like phospholipase family protein [Candidatus Obscuribacterales bacterium]
MKVSAKAIPVVLGGGGMRGPAAVGALARLEKAGVVAKSYTGVSIGSVVGSMRANGCSSQVMKDWFLNGSINIGLILKAFKPSLNPLRYIGGGVLDMLPLMRNLVETLELSPRDNLRIIAFDLFTMKPVVFEGSNYDLGLAIAASCTVPIMSKPIPYRANGRSYLLVDGGVYHPHPGEFSDEPAVVVKLVDAPAGMFSERSEDIAIDAGMPGSKYFTKLTEDGFDELFQFGYKQTDSRLCSADCKRLKAA